jgi:hypothetical protein
MYYVRLNRSTFYTFHHACNACLLAYLKKKGSNRIQRLPKINQKERNVIPGHT